MSFEWNYSSEEESVEGDNNDTTAKGNSFIWLGNQEAAVTTNEQDEEEAATFSFGGDDDSASEDDGNNHHEQVGFVNDFEGVPFAEESEDDSEDEGNGILWEDVPTEAALPVAKLAADHSVTLDLTARPKSGSETNSKRRSSKKSYRWESLSPKLQHVLRQLERTHLLALTANAVFASKQASDPLALHMVHSTLPSAWVQEYKTCPTYQDLFHFFQYFCHQIHPGLHRTADMVVAGLGRRRRRRSRGSTLQRESGASCSNPDTSPFEPVQYRTLDYCQALMNARQDDRRRSSLCGMYHRSDHVQMFLSSVRSLGWRSRYVVILDPIQRDLNVNHPLFRSIQSKQLLQRFAENWTEVSQILQKYVNRKRPTKRSKTENGSRSVYPEEASAVSRDHSSIPPLLCWVEVLCDIQHGKRPVSSKQTTQMSSAALKSSKRYQWVPVDPTLQQFDQPQIVEVAWYAVHNAISFAKTNKKLPLPYVLAVEHENGEKNDDLRPRLTDVTARYSSSHMQTLRRRGILRGKQVRWGDKERVDMWWGSMIQKLDYRQHGHRKKAAKDILPEGTSSLQGVVSNPEMDEVDRHEEKLLQNSQQQEPIPTSKAAFQRSPVYTLPSLLKTSEVLKPDAKKRVCGVFKGEFVFRREDVETALAERKWLYQGRKVRQTELRKPIRRVKKKAKAAKKSFQALRSYGVGSGNDGSENTRQQILEDASAPLDDGKEAVYASWQTEPWSPAPVGPTDPIPVNEHNNIELALVNPGLIHIDERNVAKVAKRLGIPYAPCLIGFEGHGGNRIPTIRGIVVHQHNHELLREAHTEMQSHLLQEEHENRQNSILLRWKRILVGVLTQERLERAYGDK